MYTNYSAVSCGVRQLSSIQGNDDSARRAVVQVIRDLTLGSSISQYIFSDRIASEGMPPRGGVKLSQYIQDKNLGTVVASRQVINRNSGGLIQTYIWTLPDGDEEDVIRMFKKAIDFTKKEARLLKEFHNDDWDEES